MASNEIVKARGMPVGRSWCTPGVLRERPAPSVPGAHSTKSRWIEPRLPRFRPARSNAWALSRPPQLACDVDGVYW